MLAVLCQNKELDAGTIPTEQKVMVDPLHVEAKPEVSEELVEKAAKCSLLGDDDGESDSEYEEEMVLPEPEEAVGEKRVSKTKELANMDKAPGPPKPVQRAVSSGRRKLPRRSISCDGGIKRHSWDASSRGKPKPDFRWDKFQASPPSSPTKSVKPAVVSSPRPSSPKSSRSRSPKRTTSSPTSSASSVSPKIAASPRPRPQIKRRPPRRTKSLDLRRESKSRPTITRTDSKVRFCLDSNICFEVPRPTKDMKPDLFYTKREIKTFKAEKKEEKRELKQQKKLEKQKAKENATSAAAASTTQDADAAAVAPVEDEDTETKVAAPAEDAECVAKAEDEESSSLAMGPTPIATC